MHHNKMAAGKLFFQLNGEERRWAGLAEIGDKGNAQSNIRQIQKQIIASQFNLRNQIQLMLLKLGVEKFTGAALAIQHQKRKAQEFLQGDRTSLKFRVKLAAGHEIVPERMDLPDMASGTQLGIGIIGYDQIHLAIFQKIDAAG